MLLNVIQFGVNRVRIESEQSPWRVKEEEEEGRSPIRLPDIQKDCIDSGFESGC